MNPLIGGQLISTGTDLLGSLLGFGAKKKSQELFDLSIADLQKLIGKDVLNVGQIQGQNRAAMIPRGKELGTSMAKRFNMDQPRAQKYFLDQLFNEEAKMLPELTARNQELTSDRDSRIKQMIAQLRGSQL